MSQTSTQPTSSPDGEHDSGHDEVTATELALVNPSRQSPLRRAVTTVLRSREIAIVLVLLAVIAAATIKTPSFLFSSNSWRDLLLTPSILILLAVGQAVVIITRNVDLSVGSVLGADGVPHRTALHRPPRHPDRGRARWPASPSAPCWGWSTGCWSPSPGCRPWSSRWARSTSTAASS